MTSRARPWIFGGIAALVALVVVFAIVGTGGGSSDAVADSHGHSAGVATPVPVSSPLRAGERFETLGLPEGAYEPTAQNGGTDDYRCFLVDPGLTKKTTLSGVQVLPENKAMVHHAILYKVTPEQVADAKKLDAQSPGQGWTCFGGTLIPAPKGTGAVGELDDAPWLAAWAPGGKESVSRTGTGTVLPAGSQIVLQMHYNLRAGTGTDASKVQLRLSDKTAGVTPIHTMLLPGPVELPCAPGETGLLCERSNAVADVSQRFGPQSGGTIAGLQLLCGGDPLNPVAGSTQQCTRPVNRDTTIWAAAGHMHLLGKSIEIDVNPGTPRAKTVLDIPVWDFDNQGAKPLAKPVTLKRGDTVRVRCTHDAKLRSQLPSLKNTPARYVVWGEGTTDEMCLGVLVTTYPKA